MMEEQEEMKAEEEDKEDKKDDCSWLSNIKCMTVKPYAKNRKTDPNLCLCYLILREIIIQLGMKFCEFQLGTLSWHNFWIRNYTETLWRDSSS
jgi:hypothetical protein